MSADEHKFFFSSDFLLHALHEASKASGAQWKLPDHKNQEKSPLAYLRIPLYPENAPWIQVFYSNIFHLYPPSAGKTDSLPEPELSGPALSETPVPIEKIPLSSMPCPPVPEPEDVFHAAMERLAPHKKLMTSEKRHTASLSPIALLRQWDLDRSVEIPRYEHRLTGIQTSYGRGLSLENARTACIMEAAERITAFAGTTGSEISMRLHPSPIRKATFSQLKKEGMEALDPNSLLLEAPMPDQALWWMPGEKTGLLSKKPCLVPVQCVLLFSNLPEPQLFTALGSTGLAAGSSKEGACLAGLLEVIERDAEATMPHNPENCFQIASRDPEVSRLLQAYRDQGVHPFFEDITTEFGIPSYRCLIMGNKGEVVRGTGTNLSGKKALISALTETPWPFPGPPGQKPHIKVIRSLESLPDFSTSNPANDLNRVENCLLANGFTPVHVELTRRDLRIPVVRSLVPGLEILGDFDRFSTV
ncbi:YcaO-like protein with predicted kinase domain, partial [Desulfobotulus alkaliphilus]